MSDVAGPARRRGRSWVSLGVGVQVPAAIPQERRLFAEVRAWAQVLPPEAVFTGPTAAELGGLWLPPLPAGMPRFVALPKSARRVRRPQLVVSRHPTAPACIEISDVRVASLPETLLACARHFGRLDMVVLLDGALHKRTATRGDLETMSSSRRPGAVRLREALAWADARSESPRETLLRILHRVCDVPVEPQAEIRDASGAFVARADLLIVGTRTLQEYDGEVHLEKDQYRRDRGRDRRILAADYIRNGYVADDLLLKPAQILRDADRALGRPHDPSRIRAWSALLRDSLLTESGTARALHRWGRADAQEPAA